MINGYSRFLCLNNGRRDARGCISRLLNGRAVSAGACNGDSNEGNGCSAGCRVDNERLVAPSRIHVLSGGCTVLFVHNREPVFSLGCSVFGRPGFSLARSKKTGPCVRGPVSRSAVAVSFPGVSLGGVSDVRIRSCKFRLITSVSLRGRFMVRRGSGRGAG